MCIDRDHSALLGRHSMHLVAVMERAANQLRPRLRRTAVYSCVRSMRRARIIEPRTAPRCEVHAGNRPHWQRRAGG